MKAETDLFGALKVLEKHLDDLWVVLRNQRATVIRGSVEGLWGLLEEQNRIVQEVQVQMLRYSALKDQAMAEAYARSAKGGADETAARALRQAVSTVRVAAKRLKTVVLENTGLLRRHLEVVGALIGSVTGDTDSKTLSYGPQGLPGPHHTRGTGIDTEL